MGLEFPSPDPSDSDLLAFVAFPNQGDGFGHGITDRGFLTRSGYLLPQGYDRTINMTVTDGTVLAPSYAIHYRKSPYYDATETPSYPPSFLIPWETSTFNPTVLFGIFISAWKFQDGAAAAESDATTETYASAAFHDHDGTAYLYAGTFSTTTGTAQRLQRRTQAGTWSASSDASGKYIVSAAGAFWYTTSDYQISKVPAGSDPLVAANASGSFRVGTSDSKITAISAIGASPVVFKEDGIYFWVEADQRFENKYRVVKHPNNFAFAVPNGANGIFTTTANGDFIDVQQFGAIVVDTPFSKVLDRDTPFGRIEHMATDGRNVYALVAPGAKRSQPSGMKILTTADNFGTFTDRTTTLTDSSRTTEYNIGALDTLANGDAMLIGFDTPFLAMEFVQGATAKTATIAADRNLTIAISTGAGTWSAVEVFDGTNNYSDASGFSYTCANGSGLIAIKPDQSLTTWTTATYNSLTKYWLRYTVSSLANGTINLGEVFIIPKRTGPSFTTTNFNQAEDWEATGMLVKILKLTRGEDGDVWDDIYTLPAVGTASKNVFRSPGSNKLTVSHMPTPNSPDGSLVVATRDELVQIPLPAVSGSPVVPYPVLARDATNQIAPVFYPSAIDTGGNYSLEHVEVYAQNVSQGTDYLQFAFRWDDTNAWFTTDKIYENYCHWTGGFGSNNFGQVLHTTITLVDGASTDPIGPHINAIVYWLRPLADRRPLRPARATIEVS